MNHHPIHSRRSVLKLLGTTAAGAPFVTRNLMAQSPANTLRHACFGVGGMGGSDLAHISNCENVEIVALCDVDLAQAAEARAKFPNARFYQDWRELLDKEADRIDSVNVSTPDHMHAPIGVSAMQLGKHIYGQKPLAHNLHEVRRMTELAKEKKIVTQMGIQIHSTAYYRMAAKVIQDGAIGRIKDVHTWSNKTWGDPTDKPDRTDPVPEGFDWDKWLGVAAQRPFIGGEYYHPGTWRKRLDFGTGTLGDMGCHILDPIFESLKLSAPVSVRSEGPAPNAWNWAVNGKVIYSFDRTAMTEGDQLNVTWYDGKARPPAEVVALMEGKKFPGQGTIFIGTGGVMVLPHVSRLQLFPLEKFKDYKLPRVEGESHWAQFIEACRGNGGTSADFAYAGPLTEAILLGGIASHFPNTTLKWDSPGLKFDLAEANAFVRRDYREGWRIAGLG
ncbi:MAG: Gfo/Idh/MocA family oxidoreductase [Akkermansiaceae bacterium]|jgi:predicted dehydrogenase|nr:Gfo/Idh/MocA family oxidoreductase [Akkermansiaceae bacterium]